MRRLFGFFSLLAFGLILAAMLSAPLLSVGSGSGVAAATSGAFAIDYRSLFIGVVIGLLLSSMARIGWADLPRRTLTWIATHERDIYRLGWAMLLVGVLLYY